MIEARGISYSYGKRKVLDGISFSAKDGEVVGILGNNGSGKSTLVSCINRILTPSAGDVLVDGASVSSMKRGELARIFAYVPQSTDASAMTLVDSILLGRKPYLRWRAGKKDLEICSAVINRLGLEDLQLRRLDELSGGERQKAIIARALVQEPRVMLLDEPTSSLDPYNQYEMMSTLRTIAKERGITVLVILHDLNLALSSCDSFFFMKNGKGFMRSDVDSALLADIYGIDAEIVKSKGRKAVIIRWEE